MGLTSVDSPRGRRATGVRRRRHRELSPGQVDTSRTATARVLLDTADSQLVNAAPRAADTLPMRALLLADLMASDEGHALVARDAGLRPKELAVFDPSAETLPAVRTPLLTRAAALPLTAGVPNVLNVHADTDAPTIAIEAHAPGAGQAHALADAAVAGLKSLIDAHGDHGQGRLTLEPVTPPRVLPAASAGGRVPAFVPAVVILALWCAGVLAATSPSRETQHGATTQDVRIAA